MFLTKLSYRERKELFFFFFLVDCQKFLKVKELQNALLQPLSCHLVTLSQVVLTVSQTFGTYMRTHSLSGALASTPAQIWVF